MVDDAVGFFSEIEPGNQGEGRRKGGVGGALASLMVKGSTVAG